MAVDFPSAPTVGQVVNAGDVTWRWDGAAWILAAVGGAIVACRYETSAVALPAGGFTDMPFTTPKINAGGWTLVNGNLIVPRTGQYLVSLRAVTDKANQLILALENFDGIGSGDSRTWWVETSGAVNVIQGYTTYGARLMDLAAGFALDLKGYVRAATSYPLNVTVEINVALVGAGGGGPVETAWIAPTLANGWQNYAGGYSLSGYRKIGDIVYLRGLIRNGTIGSSCFTLPVGYRPAGTEHFPVTSNDLHGSVRVQTDGQVVPTAGSNAWLALDVIQFSVTP